MTYKALCNSCLRVVTFRTQLSFAGAQANEVPCVCGGDLCGCAGCLSVLAELERGDLAPGGLSVRMESWTADGGAVGVVPRNLQLEVYGVLNDPSVGGGKTVTIKSVAARLGIKNVYVTKRSEPLNPELGHLSLTRRTGESVRVGPNVVVEVVGVGRDYCVIHETHPGHGIMVRTLLLDESCQVMQGAVSVRVADIKGSQVRLHFEAPRSISIVRTELL